MRLRKPCEHDRYDRHRIEGHLSVGDLVDCPGGEFLPEDALVIASATTEELIGELTTRGAIEGVRLDYQATERFKGLLDDPEERCPSCGGDDHVDGCERLDTCGQFGPPWIDKPWHPQPDLAPRGNTELRVAFDVRAREWSRAIDAHAFTHKPQTKDQVEEPE